MKQRKILQMNQISKSFGASNVLNKVDFDLLSGEVHILIGENGAGKSTLMKILAGILPKDDGEIFIENSSNLLDKVEIKSSLTAINMGISMVFQESNLIDNITVSENMYLGKEPIKRGVIDWERLHKDTQIQLDKVKCLCNPKQLVENLSVAEKQTVEIAKALSCDAKIIIFDEPTSSLSDKEVDILFDLIRETKKTGVGIIYISHRMEEIFTIGDRITVLRDGNLIGTVEVDQTNPNDLVKMMVGRELEQDYIPPVALPDDTDIALSVRDVHVMGEETPVSFDVYKGEILGVFGLVGAGRTELARILFGIDPIHNGKIVKEGVEIRNSSPFKAVDNGFAFLPEDRKNKGLITEMSVCDNITLVKLRDLKKILWNKKKEKEIADDYIKKLKIVVRDQEQEAKYLSGGNQQKVVYAKWMSMHPDILILDEPTRGIDVGAKADIYHIMEELTRNGVTIIHISSDLPEILRVSNRVMVMHDYKITMVEKRENVTQETIMEAAII